MAQGADFDFSTIDFGDAAFDMPQFTKPSEDNTSQPFWDEGIDTATTGAFGQQSYDSMAPSMFATSQEQSFDMQQTLTMDNTMMASQWHNQLVPTADSLLDASLSAFPPTPSQSFDSLYQPTMSSALGKRPLELDIQDFPQPKRHENYSLSPFTSSASATGSSWALETQPTPAPSASTSCEMIGLSDEAADVCATWFSKYAVLPSDRHIESLSQLTGESPVAIRNWFSQLMRQGMAGHDSAYKSQTGICQGDQTWTEQQPTSEPTTEQTPCNHDTTTSQPTLRGGKKGCVPTENPELLRRDSNKIYQCTRKCGKRYGRKCDWKRNEEEGYPSKSWICNLCKTQGVEKVKPCFRKYHFSQHFRNIHPGLNCADYEEESIVHTDTAFPRKCGFCPYRFTSRQERIDHIADHFKKGKCMLDWNDDDDDSNDSDNMDDDDDDHRPDSGGFDGQSFFQPPPGNQGGSGSKHNGGGSGGSSSGSSNGGDQQSSSGFFQFQLQQLEREAHGSGAQCGESNRRSSPPSSDSRVPGPLCTSSASSSALSFSYRGPDCEQQSAFERIDTPEKCPTDVQGYIANADLHGRNNAPAGGDSHSVAGDVVARSLSESRDITRDSPSVSSTYTSDEHATKDAPNSPQDQLVRQPNTDKACVVVNGEVSSPTPDLLPKPSPTLDVVNAQSPEPESGAKDLVQQSGEDTRQANVDLFKQRLLSVFKDSELAVQLADVCAELVTSGKNDQRWHEWSSQQDQANDQASNTVKARVEINHDYGPLTNPDSVKSLLELAQVEHVDIKPVVVEMTEPVDRHAEEVKFSTFGPFTPSRLKTQDTISHADVSSAQSFLSVKLLGTGGFSTVDEVVHRETKLRVSRKTLKNRDQSAIDELKKEVSVLQKLRHPHIIRFLGAYSKGDKMSILLSPVAEMTLAVWLDRNTLQRPAGIRQTIVTMLGCLASSVRYLHEQRPVVKHMDIKPQNILIVQGNNEYPHVVLSDFGISSSDDAAQHGESKPLTRQYCAPEVLNKISREQAADIWSLGCVFAEMASVAFNGDNPRWLDFRRTFSSRKDKYYWQDVPGLHAWLLEFVDEAKTTTEVKVVSTVKSMLSNEPAERPNAALLTMTFTPAPCCISWPKDDAAFPGPHAEMTEVEMFANGVGTDPLAHLHVRNAVKQGNHTFDQGKNWLEECVHDHEACVWQVTEPKSLPTRLIEVLPEGIGCPVIRVVDSSAIVSGSSQSRYAALSHTWSQSRLHLTSKNLHSLQTKGVREEVLPQAVKDAVSATRGMGLRYMWADSLCILQDSEDDKQRECEAMASVYRNADVCLVAQQAIAGDVPTTSVAKDRRHGKHPCSSDSSLQCAEPHAKDSLPSTRPCVSEPTTDLSPIHALTRAVDLAPVPTAPTSLLDTAIDFTVPAFGWNTSAWSFQERLLSRRFLRLGEEQLYWECNTLKASETFPRGLPSLLWEKVHTRSVSVKVELTSANSDCLKPCADPIAHPEASRLRDCQWIKKEAAPNSERATQMGLELSTSRPQLQDQGHSRLSSSLKVASLLANATPATRQDEEARRVADDSGTSLIDDPRSQHIERDTIRAIKMEGVNTDADVVMHDADLSEGNGKQMLLAAEGSYVDYGGDVKF